MMTIAWALCAGSVALGLVTIGRVQHARLLIWPWLAGAILGALHLMDVV
jgi:hypothetical protein